MAVGFGFSVGDIITCGKLANDIYENCFTKEHAAGVKYAQFGLEIKSLSDSLGRLERIFNNASDQGLRPLQQNVALQALPEVTGDFRRTLRDCETLLRRHARLQHGRPSLSDNFEWWTSVERDVNSLRERVKFHATKVAFIAKPFETQLLLGIRHDLQRVERAVAHLTGIVTNGIDQTRRTSITPYLASVKLPDSVLTRFILAFNTNRPACFEESSNWPLKEGFDALVFHFSKSTIEFNSRPELGQKTPEGPQYLNLLKSVWIMEQLKASVLFQDAGTDSLWGDYMRELEDEIRLQFRRFDAGQLIAPPQDVVSILPDSCYSIWVEEDPPPHSLDMTEQRPLEEKILELSLPQSYGTRQTTLTVFRKSDSEFRLVTTTKMADNPMFSYAEGFNVDMTFTRLIPSYATPRENASMTNNLVLCNDRGRSPEWLSLNDATSVASLQRALLGYRVHHDMSNISWCINGSNDESDWGKGRLQLWQPKLLPAILSDGGAQSVNNRNNSLSNVHLPQLDYGNDTFRSGITELDSGPGSPARPLGGFTDASNPTSTNNSSYSKLVSAQIRTKSDRPLWNNDSPRTSSRPLSNGLKYEETKRTIRSPSLSNWGSESPCTVSTESTWRPELDRHSTGKSSTTMATGSSIVSPVSGPRSEGTELLRPEVPVLVIFTMCKARYVILHVKLEQPIFVNPRSCACKNPKRNCTRTVLESSSKKKPFTVHKFSADQEYEKGLFSWDLALFRRPRHPQLKNVSTVEKMKTLDLAFSSVAAKNEFLGEFAELENIRSVEQNEYDKHFQEKKRRAL